MKALIQRVTKASVSIDNQIYSKIDQGLLVLLGISQNDTVGKIDWLVNKIVRLRIFSDKAGKMNLSIKDITGQIILVSQFTLYADCKKGNRPSFTQAAKTEKAEKLYNIFITKLKQKGIEVKTGEFGAMMQVNLINDGPVTIDLER